MKVVINRKFGGFGLSEKGWDLYIHRGGEHGVYDIPRNCPILVSVVEDLGEAADCPYSKLKVIDISFTSDEGEGWYIHDYDGMEKVKPINGEWY